MAHSAGTDALQPLTYPAFIAASPCSGAWILLYAVEAAAIVSLMNRNPGKSAETELSTALSALPSRKMFPSTLTPVKDALAHTLAAGASAAATTSVVLSAAAANIAEQQAIEAATPAQLVAAPPGVLDHAAFFENVSCPRLLACWLEVLAARWHALSSSMVKAFRGDLAVYASSCRGCLFQ